MKIINSPRTVWGNDWPSSCYHLALDDLRQWFSRTVNRRHQVSTSGSESLSSLLNAPRNVPNMRWNLRLGESWYHHHQPLPGVSESKSTPFLGTVVSFRQLWLLRNGVTLKLLLTFQGNAWISPFYGTRLPFSGDKSQGYGNDERGWQILRPHLAIESSSTTTTGWWFCTKRLRLNRQLLRGVFSGPLWILNQRSTLTWRMETGEHFCGFRNRRHSRKLDRSASHVLPSCVVALTGGELTISQSVNIGTLI